MFQAIPELLKQVYTGAVFRKPTAKEETGPISEPDEPDEPEEQFSIVGEAVHGVGVMTNYIRQQNQEFVVTNEEFKTLLSIKEKILLHSINANHCVHLNEKLDSYCPYTIKAAVKTAQYINQDTEEIKKRIRGSRPAMEMRVLATREIQSQHG
ncbi:6468_t:CDS:2 [Paraglomus brasilianum]|uniref:6468_t:CDS:1 n=1 Tax=Paraglomus brasilianum TaxID=144538 RepID=A0A9N8YZ62_9GLOM|nr:6468_t:CDS:2 [Paraglomus brasilianum]